MNIKTKLLNIKTRLQSFFLHPDSKLIFVMFFPILLEQLLSISTGTVHSIMISNLGKQAISAVGLVDQLNGLFVTIATSLGTGATVLVAQYIGAKNERQAKKYAAQALLAGTILTLITGSILLIFGDKIFVAMYGETEKEVFDYAMVYMKASVSTFPTFGIYSIAAGILRASGDMKRPMQISFISGIINVIVSAILIYGFNMGTLGAGLGLVVSRIYSSVCAIIVLCKGKWIQTASDLLIIRFKYLGNILKISVFVGLESVLFYLGKILTNSYIVSAGTDHIAANSIAGALVNIYLSFGNAFTVVATTLVGRYIGAHNKDDAYSILGRTAKLATIILSVICFITIPLYPLLFKMYTTDTAILPLLYKIMLMNAISLPTVWVLAGIFPSGFRGAGDIMFSSFNAIVNMWCVRILFAYIFAMHFGMGVVGVWLAQYIEWGVRSCINFWRYKSHRWLNKKLVKE